jgi:hypothetical protein
VLAAPPRKIRKGSPVTVQAVDAPRSLDLPALVAMLTEQHAQQLDMVVPASKIRARGGRLVITGADGDVPPVLGDEGFTYADGVYDMTDTADKGLAAKLDIPLKALRDWHANRPDIWDMLVNRLLHGGTVRRDGEETIYPADERSFLIRTFVTPTRRVIRAWLSNGYKIVDNLDMLLAVLDGVREAEVEVEVDADLTDRRMYVRLVAPGVSVVADALLAGYRSPFASPDIQRAGRAAQAYSGGTGNVHALNAGLYIKNSEVGDGGYSLTPRAVFPVCANGLTVTADAIGGIHLGSRQADGVIVASEDTREKELALIKAQVRDAVQQFMHPDYLERTIARVQEQMGVAVAAPDEHVRAVAKKLSFSQEQADGILRHFILGGQVTSGGVMQAVTSYAQTVSDADVAAELEEMALDVLETSASLARAAR